VSALKTQTRCCYCSVSSVFLSSVFLFYLLIKICAHFFSSLETSVIDLKLYHKCAEWSQFLVDYFSGNLTYFAGAFLINGHQI